MGGEDPNRVFTSVGCEDEILTFVHECTSDALEIADGSNVAALSGVDNVDRIVGRMRQIQLVATMMDRGMVEAAIGPMRRQLDFSDALQPHATV